MNRNVLTYTTPTGAHTLTGHNPFKAALATATKELRVHRIRSQHDTQPYLDPDYGDASIPLHLTAHMESDSTKKSDVFKVRAWLMRRECMVAYNLLTDEEVQSTLNRHNGYIRGAVRTLAATYDGIVI